MCCCEGCHDPCADASVGPPFCPSGPVAFRLPAETGGVAGTVALHGRARRWPLEAGVGGRSRFGGAAPWLAGRNVWVGGGCAGKPQGGCAPDQEGWYRAGAWSQGRVTRDCVVDGPAVPSPQGR